MAQVTVSLEDGFAQDHVVIRVDGFTAFEGTEVTTRLQTGLAAAVPVQTSDASSLEVTLPDRGLTRAIDLDGSRTPFVRASIVDGDLDVSTTDQAPYYA
ncbi:MAG: hypothetical protein ABJA93_03255 [Sporichthyaceae bacterium]